MKDFQKNVQFIDANGQTVFVEIEVKAGRLSMVGTITGGGAGQIQGRIKPANDAQKELIDIWQRWHLNDMKAGTARQLKAVEGIADLETICAQIGGEFSGSPYEKQANDFLQKHGITFSAKFKGHAKYFQDDEQARDIFTAQFRRGRNAFSVTFGQSIANQGTPPTAYDVLACLTKSDPEDLQTFCDNYGYDPDSITANRTYNAVCTEWAKVNQFFTDAQIEELQNIG